MALIPNRISFPISGGQEQGIAAELVDPPSLIWAHNVVYDRQGELTKRRGWRTFDERKHLGGTLPYGDRLLVRDNELVRIGEQRTINWTDPAREPCRIYTRTVGETREEATPRPWMAKGKMPRFNVSRELEISHPLAGEKIQNFDVAFAGDALASGVGESGVLCAIWQYAAGTGEERIDWATVDAATGSLIAQGTLVNGASISRLIRVVALKGSDSLWYFHAFWGEGEFLGEPGDALLYHASMPAYRPWSWSAADLITDELEGYDVCVCNPSAVGGFAPFERRLFLVTAKGDGTLRCELYRPGALGTISTVTNAARAETAFQSGHVHCCCDPNGQHVGVYVSRVTATENLLIQFNAAAGPAGLVTYYDRLVLDTGGPHVHSGQVGWVGTTIDETGTLRYDNWFVTWKRTADHALNTRCEFFTATSVGGFLRGGTAFVHYCTHWSRIFSYRGDAYHIVLKGISPDAVECEVLSWWDESDAVPLPEKHARFAGGELAFNVNNAGRDVLFGKGRNSIVESWYHPGRFFTVIPVVSDNTDHKLALFSISASEYDKQQYSGALLNGSLSIASGVPWLYDGDQGHELGFSHRPQSDAGEITAASVAVGPPYLAAATYYVAMCWEATDSKGNISRSAPSHFGPVVIGANANLSVTFASLGPTSHRNVRPVVYVSNDGGLNHVRSRQILTNATAELADATVNLDPVLLFVSGMPTLYTDQSILSNAPLMAARFACEWQNRIWFMSDNIVWPSREVIYGEEPSFNEAMQFRIPANGSGMASLDDRLILFTRDRIYWIAGDGPTDTGEGGSFTQPQRVPSDFGCIDARSIVRCEKGILFQSRRGIELLGRALETTLISGGIDRYLREYGYTEIVASSLDPKNQIARFILKTTTGAYVVACWHVLFGLWTTADVPRSDALIGRGNLPFGLAHALDRNWMTLNDRAGETTPIEPLLLEMDLIDAIGTRYMDGGTPGTGYWYGCTIETANVKLDGLLGFARLWRVYVEVKNKQSHTGIRIAYCLDYSPSLTGASRSWTTLADLGSGQVNSAYHHMFAVHIDRQQCSAVRLFVEEKQETGLEPPAVADVNTYMTFVGFGVEFGQKPGTGRGAERSKK